MRKITYFDLTILTYSKHEGQKHRHTDAEHGKKIMLVY